MKRNLITARTMLCLGVLFFINLAVVRADAPPTDAVPFAGNSAPLTLDEIINIALRQHGDVGSAEQNYYGSVEGITSARSAYYPQVTGTVDYNYQNGSRQVTNNSSSSFSSSGFTSNVGITQNIFDGGKIKATVQQAKAATTSAIGAVGLARNNLAFEVATNFYGQLLDEKLVEQRQGEVSLAQQQLDMIQAQVDAGTAARSDVQSVQVNLSQAQFDVVTSQNALRVAQVKLRQSMGLGRGPALVLSEPALTQTAAPVAAATAPSTIPGAAKSTFTLPPLPPLPAVLPLQSIDVYLQQAQQLRPDLLQSLANVDQSKAQLSLAKVAQRPQVSVSAGYNLDAFNIQNRSFNFGAGVSIPIFDGGGRKADERAAEDNLSASQIRLDQLQKDVAADVESTYVSVSGENQRIKNARALVEAARTNFQTASEKYQLGLGIVLDVVNAQTQLFSAQTSLIQALYDYQLALADLDRAVGRFAWANPGVVPPTQAPRTLPEAIAVNQPH